MKFIVDTHVHIYPFYDLGMVLRSINTNLASTDTKAERVACLTERFDCNVFQQLLEGTNTDLGDEFQISPSPTGKSVKLTNLGDGSGFTLLPGQQIITAENIEILSLNCVHRVPEGKSAAETIESVSAAGGIPVIAWAVGKWFFKRGKVVQDLIDRFSPSQVAIGDTSLRPRGWLTPILMRSAKNKGFRVLAGSDPLPYSGEEMRPGCYVSRLEVDGNSLHPEEAIGYILSPDAMIESVGRRGSIFEVVGRLYNHRQAEKSSHTVNP